MLLPYASSAMQQARLHGALQPGGEGSKGPLFLGHSARVLGSKNGTFCGGGGRGCPIQAPPVCDRQRRAQGTPQPKARLAVGAAVGVQVMAHLGLLYMATVCQGSEL